MAVTTVRMVSLAQSNNQYLFDPSNSICAPTDETVRTSSEPEPDRTEAV